MIRTDQQKAQEFYKRMNAEIKSNKEYKYRDINPELWDGIKLGIEFAMMHYKFIYKYEDETLEKGNT